MPIFRSGDLRHVGFVAIDEPSEHLAGLRGNADRQQEMPHHRHLVTTEDEALNIAEVEWVFRTGSGVKIAVGNFVLHAPEQTAEEASAFFRGWRLCLVVLTHSASPFMIRPTWNAACCRQSGHGCPEPKALDRPGRTRSGCDLLSPQNR